MKYEIYGGTSCASCTTAKNILEAKGLEYDYKNVDTDMEALNEVVSNKFRALPMIKLNGELVGTLKDLQDSLK